MGNVFERVRIDRESLRAALPELMRCPSRLNYLFDHLEQFVVLAGSDLMVELEALRDELGATQPGAVEELTYFIERVACGRVRHLAGEVASVERLRASDLGSWEESPIGRLWRAYVMRPGAEVRESLSPGFRANEAVVLLDPAFAASKSRAEHARERFFEACMEPPASQRPRQVQIYTVYKQPWIKPQSRTLNAALRRLQASARRVWTSAAREFAPPDIQVKLFKHDGTFHDRLLAFGTMATLDDAAHCVALGLGAQAMVARDTAKVTVVSRISHTCFVKSRGTLDRREAEWKAIDVHGRD